MAFLGPESVTAAEAWFCAIDQGKGEEYSRLLYQRQGGPQGRATFSKDNLKLYASELKLDGTAFATCLDSGKHSAKVASERLAGQAAKIEATPSLVIDGEIIKGVPEPNVLESKIQAALKKRGQ
jgi:protein-disulfide isomerase